MPGEKTPLIVGIGGTAKVNSTSERALATSLKAAERAGARTLMIRGHALVLPMYTPNEQDRSDEARALVDAFRRADGIIVSSPAYHGSVSGLVKNALDYAEDLRTDERVYFDGLPVGLIACAAGWQGAGQTLSAMRAIVHSLRGWPTPLGGMLNTTIGLFDADGECTDMSSRFQLETIGQQVVDFARWRAAAAPLGLQPLSA